MERLSDIVARLLHEEGLFAQVFSGEDPDGSQTHYNATRGMRIARESGSLRMLSLAESGLTVDRICSCYDGLDESYALTTDTSRPVLFVLHRGTDLCVDGWHRLFKAACIGQEEIPAYFLTEHQTETIKILTLPPEQGIDWGQRSNVC